jgi:hypothetical protein
MVHDSESNERHGHSEEIEKKWRDVLKSVFYQNERGTPNAHDRQEQEVSQGAGA